MDRALIGGVAVLERAVSYTLGSLALVTTGMLERPTPCRCWNLHALLEHLNDSMAALQEAADERQVDRRPADLDGDVVGSVRDQATRLLGSWAAPPSSPGAVQVLGSPVTAPLVAGAGAIEVTVHGWDVASACGVARPIPDELADELLDLAVLFVRSRDRPGRFGPPLDPPPDAGAGDRLLAFLGR